MAMRIPKTLKNFNCFIEGTGYAGVATEVSLPTIELNADAHRAGGMDMPRKIDLGINEMEAEVTLTEMNADVAGKTCIHNGSNTQMMFRGALNDDESTAAVPVVAIMRGTVSKYEPSSAKSSEKTEDKFTFSLKFYELKIDGREVFHIDGDNLIRRIDGTDQLESIRSAIGF